tara:strand:+ start:145 stop:1254 length:1110 start_codon:yes stop_codon:yes gene_type:complete
VYNNLIENLTEFIQTLENPEKKYHYFPVLSGATFRGNKVELGFSCYAMKCYFMLNQWEKLDLEIKENWVDYINSFQSKNKKFPQSSYIDNVVLNDYETFNLKKGFKNFIKFSVNSMGIKSYELEKQKLDKTIVAETKQAISTLYMVGKKNRIPYLDFPKEEGEIINYLNKFDWSRPWNAGAQFASLCVFVSTQLNENERIRAINYLEKYINNKVDQESGLYFENNLPNSVESINGAMKVLTGFEWLESKIHYPEKIIDYCLNQEPNNEGCDLVDIVYVLNRCGKQTDYKKSEIIDYLNLVEKMVMKHYIKGDGGFSYFIEKSQTHYYGVKISNGLPRADIHGTTLLIWALSLIDDFRTDGQSVFNKIKA